MSIDAHFNALARQRKAAEIRAQFTASGERIIHLDADIGQAQGELSAKWLREQMPTDGSPVVLQVHCAGGSVFEGFAMLDVLAAYPGKVKAVVSSLAASAASMLLCGCSEIEISPNGFVMLHDSHMAGDTETSPSERELINRLNENMIEIYAKRTRKPASEIRRAMASEKWLNATEAVRFGLADKIVDPARRAVAKASPKRIVAKATPQPSAVARWNTAVSACGNVSLANRQYPGFREQMLKEVNSNR